jgi:O-antigen/teichoic acid export membrane protein
VVSLQTQTRPALRRTLPPARLDGPAKPLVSVAQVFLCDFAAKALWALAGLALIRFLSEGEYAALTLALALSGLMADGVNENLNRLYIVGHAKLRLAGTPLSFLTLQFSMLAVAAALMFGFSGQVEGLYWLIVALAFANGAQAFVRTLLQRELKFWSFSLVEMARTLMFVVALVALIAIRRDHIRAWEVLLLQVTCLTVVSGTALAGNLKNGRLGWPREAWRIARQIATGGYGLMIAYTLLLSVLARIDIVMIKVMDSPLELATYGAAFRYYGMLTLLLGAVHTVVLPLTQQATGLVQLEAIFARYRRVLLGIVPVMLLGAWLSQWLIPLIDGGKYPGAVVVFQMLTISIVVGLAFSPYVNLLFRYGDFSFLVALASADLVLDVGLNILLIPTFHSMGAAMALCIAIGTMNFLVYLRARALMASRPLPAETPVELPTTTLAVAAE